MPTKTVEDCVGLLVSRGLKIAFVESATAGRLSAEFSMVVESGKILLGGIVCYDVSIKTSLLEIPNEIIDEFTPESAEVTKALAENLRQYFDADIIVAVTGLATPGGSESPEKPVGTMFFHILLPDGFVSHREVFHGSPEQIITNSIDKVCVLITARIAKNSNK